MSRIPFEWAWGSRPCHRAARGAGGPAGMIAERSHGPGTLFLARRPSTISAESTRVAPSAVLRVVWVMSRIPFEWAWGSRPCHRAARGAGGPPGMIAERTHGPATLFLARPQVGRPRAG